MMDATKKPLALLIASIETFGIFRQLIFVNFKEKISKKFFN